jgi:hypothetical protein
MNCHQTPTVKEEIHRYSSQYSAHPNDLVVNLMELQDDFFMKNTYPEVLLIEVFINVLTGELHIDPKLHYNYGISQICVSNYYFLCLIITYTSDRLNSPNPSGRTRAWGLLSL